MLGDFGRCLSRRLLCLGRHRRAHAVRVDLADGTFVTRLCCLLRTWRERHSIQVLLLRVDFERLERRCHLQSLGLVHWVEVLACVGGGLRRSCVVDAFEVGRVYLDSVSSFRSIPISPPTVSDSSKAFLEIGLAHLLALRI